MTRCLMIAAGEFLLSEMPAFGESTDADGVPNSVDNCYDDFNPDQDDTDGDSCGNACDADYNQNGLVTFADFGEFLQNFGLGNEEFCHVPPISGCTVGIDDFGFFARNFNSVPGPSGTTPGTVACPAG